MTPSQRTAVEILVALALCAAATTVGWFGWRAADALHESTAARLAVDAREERERVAEETRTACLGDCRLAGALDALHVRGRCYCQARWDIRRWVTLEDAIAGREAP